MIEDVAGQTLAALLQIGQAHADLRLALIDRNGLFPAGIVAAAAAVELIRGLLFAHLPQDLGKLAIPGQVAFLDERQALGVKLLRRRLREGEIRRPGAAVHRLMIPHRGTVEFSMTGPPTQPPAQMDISMKQRCSPPCIRSSSTSMQLWAPSTER